ncbi:iron-hydroxamate ABC transporter substrate-binding protein [Priestia megaterium]|uniref:iron-hydroxamate ABC transporter substrate-binding protein n=1 Tax=Priestia megaterium TaxID=1404 RepID=UPI002A6A701E|nr:iron-hydroxamate ABC transporter substrate-binding protein [Priestia megaterium]MDY0940665.1 iron-hydroxamate ABC transporter substrate-binding protein [Priestia megaterium]
MKKLFFIPFLLILTIIVSACGNSATTNGKNDGNTENETFTYESETGPVKVPKNPKRIVALSNGPNVMSLGGKLVGIDEWSSMNPLFKEKVKGVEVVSEDDLEKIMELKPDLIIAGSEMKNIKKLNKIAPTVVYTWGKLDYLNQQIEIGKLLNKEKEAKEWVNDFQKRAASAGEAIRKKIGKDATVSVIESGNKEFYVFGNNYARGTEVLYQAMKLNISKKVKEKALASGIYTFSSELLPEFAGDYIILSKSTDGDNSFLKTSVWKNIPAVKNNRVFEINTKASTYSDPITLEYLLGYFEKSFLKK